MYHALILPSLEYCNVVWGNAANKHLCKLKMLQNRAGKIILSVNRRFPTKGMLDGLGWKTLELRRAAHLNILVYKCLAGLAHPNLCINFNSVRDNSPHETRGSSQGNLVPSKFKTGSGKRSFKYRGAVSWNKLPAVCKSPLPLTANQFKCALKTHLLVQYSI